MKANDNNKAAMPLPKWLMQRYSTLYSLYRNKEFTYEQALFALKGTNLTSMVLSKLNKHGWLEMKLHPEDARKRIYRLRQPDDAIRSMAVNQKPRSLPVL